MDNLRPDTYEMHPSDIIDEEDFEESVDGMSSVKK